MPTASKPKPDRLPTRFDGLNDVLPLRPIADQAALENAMKVADRLAVLDRRTRDQDDYLDTLSLLIERYEAEHVWTGIPRSSPVDALKFLMAQHDMSASDLGRLLGNRELGPAILRGTRQISKHNIRTLADHFKVSADLFV